MPHIMLTETESIATESVEMVRLMERNGTPVVELYHKPTDLPPSYFWGEEAGEAWGNWQKFVRRAGENRRGGAIWR